MNIFVIGDEACPKLSATQLNDRHVLKQGLEAIGMLNTALPEELRVWKCSHINHPCSVWARTSLENYLWLCTHGKAIFEEYTNRYGKIHKSAATLQKCYELKDEVDFKHQGLTPFAQAMPEGYKNENAVIAYRSYYIGEKQHLAKWKTNNIPPWYVFKKTE